MLTPSVEFPLPPVYFFSFLSYVIVYLALEYIYSDKISTRSLRRAIYFPLSLNGFLCISSLCWMLHGFVSIRSHTILSHIFAVHNKQFQGSSCLMNFWPSTLSYLLSCNLEIDIDLCLKMPTAELAQTWVWKHIAVIWKTKEILQMSLLKILGLCFISEDKSSSHRWQLSGVSVWHYAGQSDSS